MFLFYRINFFRRLPPLHIALYGGHYVTDDWPADVPVIEEELQILEAHLLELLPEVNELEI